MLETAFVTDDLDSMKNLSHVVDENEPENRSLVIRLTMESGAMDLNDLKGFYVCVQVNTDSAFQYLGTYCDPHISHLEWKETSSRVFNQKCYPGPQPGNTFLFKVHAVIKSKKPLAFGPFQFQGPIMYR